MKRYTFEATFPHGTIPKSFVKATPPILDPSADNITWQGSNLQPIIITYPDCNSNTPELASLYAVLSKYYAGYTSTDKFEPGNGTLISYDPSMLSFDDPQAEEWCFYDIFPTSIYFDELDHSSSQPINISVTFRFNKCEYKKLKNELSVYI
jgi:hypothetical protein